MKIEDLHRTKIEVEVPAGQKSWMPWPDNSIKIDGHVMGRSVNVGVKHELDAFGHTIEINGNRVFYPTDLWVNDVLRATDEGLLWSMRPIDLSGDRDA